MHGGDPRIHPNLALPTLSTRVTQSSLIVVPYRDYYNNCGHQADAAKPAFACSLSFQPGLQRDSSRILQEGRGIGSFQQSIKAFVRNDNNPAIEEV